MIQPQLSVDLAPHEQQLGKYRLVARLGQGGMGTVYLAMASGLGAFRKLLVVKELRHDLPWKESSLSMFMDEAQLAARLDHPNVLQTFEAGEHEGRYFLAMEYLDGQALSTLIERAHARGGVPLELHVYMLCEVLHGLQYAHDLTDYDGSRLHVVHRDVSPQNVFVTHHGQVKVVDFGVAKANNGSNITSPGVFKGKFAYAAPEQLLGRPVDGRCDVFAVGVMLWEAIAGRRFGVPKPSVDAFRIRTHGLEPKIAEVAPDVDPLLAEICEHALAVDPLARTESAGTLRAQLQEWLLLQGEHVQNEDVAAFMRELFREERKARRQIIERAMVDAGASHSVIAELPRELTERESGMAPRVDSVQEPPAEPLRASVIAQAPRAALRVASDTPQTHAPPVARVRTGLSRLSSAAVLIGLAIAVFVTTYQLSRSATHSGRAARGEQTEPPQRTPEPASPGDSSGATGVPEQASEKASAQPSETVTPATFTTTREAAGPVHAGDEPSSQQQRHAQPERRPRDQLRNDAASRDREPVTAAREASRAGFVVRDNEPAGRNEPTTLFSPKARLSQVPAAAEPESEPTRAARLAAPRAAAADRAAPVGSRSRTGTAAPRPTLSARRDPTHLPQAPTPRSPKSQPTPPSPRTAKALKMGVDLRQTRGTASNGPGRRMRIDTEDPYQ